MATWAEFSTGSAEVRSAAAAGERGEWVPLEGGAGKLLAAGERLLFPEIPIALLGTVSPSGRPRIHPFIPKVVDGRLWAFIVETSPKRRDLERNKQYTIHSALAEEDEEFWVAGRAQRHDDPALRERVSDAMRHPIHDWETLFEFDLDIAVWTRWLDFGTPNHRPQHHRWRSAAS